MGLEAACALCEAPFRVSVGACGLQLPISNLQNGWVMAEWAVTVRERLRPSLPDASRRGPKRVEPESSLMVRALVQVAWQLTYAPAHPQ